jgi:hypothetical protein
LITGGALGIGAATAAELTRRGPRVVLADLDASALESAAAAMSPGASDDRARRHRRSSVRGGGRACARRTPSPPQWRRSRPLRICRPTAQRKRAWRRCQTRCGLRSRRMAWMWRPSTRPGSAPTRCAGARVRYGLSRSCEQRSGRRSNGRIQSSAPLTDIPSGFEQRRRRICTPRFVYGAHALRPPLTTRVFQRKLLAVAPEMERAFQQELAERGVGGASVSERVASQLAKSAERVQA